MNRPTPHPKTGIYLFRKGVPDSLRALVGKREVKISLRTRDPEQAKSRHLEVAAEVERHWASLVAAGSAGAAPAAPVRLPKETLTAFAGEIYAALMAEHERDPGDARDWQRKLEAIQQSLPFNERLPGHERQAFSSSFTFGPHWAAQQHLGPRVKAYLDERGLVLTADSFTTLCLFSAGAVAQAYRVLIKRAGGDFRPDPERERFPKVRSTENWRTLYALYCGERKPEPSSIKRQRGVLTALFAFLGHDLPSLVSPEDAVRWKEKRIGEVSPQNVRDADLAHPRAFFKWARKNRKIEVDPFADVHVTMAKNARYGKDGRKKIRGDRGFTPEQAVRILRATLVPVGKGMSQEGRAARRWVPWLCAYTGARVNELTQMRASDVVQMKDSETGNLVWMLRITPEAGRVKDGEARDIALHRDLIAQGFLKFVESRKGRRLFYDPSRSASPSPEHPQYVKVAERLAKWIRSDKVGIVDKEIAPNHAWRHRVRSQLVAAGVQEQIINRIDGHAADNVGQTYGTVWPDVCLEAVSKIPAYDIEGKFDDLA